MKKLALLAPLLLAVAGCPKPRTSAATQPTPVAFDSAQSDAAAVAVVDAGITALGGADKWEALKELRFTIKYTNAGKTQAEYTHYWDRWNGRHRLITVDMSTVGGDPDDVKEMDVRYDLYDKGATPNGRYNGEPLLRADTAKQVVAARERLKTDLYFIAMIYKLKDPGVILKIDNAEITVPDSDACKPSCTAVKVTFDPAVGTETWIVNYNNESKLPEIIEQQRGAGRLGYHLTDWTESGGLKWPGALHNIGLAAEVLMFDDVKVGNPDDATYMPSVQGGG